MFSSTAVGLPSAGDLAWHGPVVAATTAALPASTAALGPPGTLTANANGALPAVDGIALAVADRVLVKDEAAAATNGIYVVTSLGSAGTPWVLTRAADADEVAELPAGSVTYATSGTVNGRHFLYLPAAVAIMGTTAQAWTLLDFTPSVTVRTYTANGTWNRPAAANFLGVLVRCQGAGGAGGRAVVTAAAQASSGAGGGGGGYRERWIPAASLVNATEAITVGAGGVGSAAGLGTAGGFSQFGALTLAQGGDPGGETAASGTNAGVIGSSGGAPGGADLSIKGGPGGSALILGGSVVWINRGGDAHLGFGASNPSVPGVGLTGGSYGGGGSGASNVASLAAKAGGNGGPGIVIVEERYGG